MREKILAELRKKFAGLPANVLGLVATQLAKKVTEESQIEGAITELENSPISLTDYAKFVQQEGDKRVSDALKKAKNTADTDEDEEDEDEPAPAPAKKPKKGESDLAKQVQTLTQTVQNLLATNNQKSLTEKLHAKMKEKDIPVRFAKGVTVEKEEDIETAFSEIETDYADFKQELLNQGLAVQTKPAGGSGGPGSGANTTSLDADITAWAGAGKKEEKK